MAKDNEDSLKELEQALIKEKLKAKKKLNEDIIAKEQEAEDLRIKNKKEGIKKSAVEDLDKYNQDLESFQGMILDLIGDVNDLLMLAYRGKVGKNIVPNLTKISNKVLEYRKNMNNTNLILNAQDRQSMLFVNKKIDNLMKSVVVPMITKDENKKKRLKEKL